MNLATKIIYLKESEKDIFKALKTQGIQTKNFEYKFKELFQRVYNNEVGYYSFIQDNILYKLIILPKTIAINSPNREKEFINYLLHFYRVNNKYSQSFENKIPNSVLSLAFEANNKDDNVGEAFELFESYKTIAILKNIEAFFQKHKNYKRVEKSYISQSVKYKLNLAKNIKELDKTKIHQSKKEDILYSQIATISYFALKLFALKKVKNITFNQDKIKNLVNKISSLIARKYLIDKSFSLNLSKLYSQKIAKVFAKKNEHKLLLSNIQSLFGYEQLFSSKEKKSKLRNDFLTSSFFINPSQFYEWYVYDILDKYAKNSGLELKFDKVNQATTTTYLLNKDKAKSKPDFILIDKEKKVAIVLDAKWKNIDTISDITSSDYLKLQFDEKLLRNKEFATLGYLIYPKISLRDNKIEIKYNQKGLYSFNLLEIDMNFTDKKQNNLNFEYDFSKQEQELKEQEQKEIQKNEAIKSKKNIEPKRQEHIKELINANDNDEKEKLYNNFDIELLKESKKLTSSLEEIILPEIKEILNEFEDILEEQSIIFLKSSSTLYAHYKNEDLIFDFSMPASGLWKLIEVELNTSFIWLLRILSSVCNNQSPWKKVCKLNAKIDQTLDSGKRVALSMSDKKDKRYLQSVMLGGIKLLLEDNSTINEFNDYFHDYPEDKQFISILPQLLQDVITFRNEHAHIKAMSKDKFQALWNLLFSKDINTNQLQKLCSFKRNIKVYIKNI